MTFQQGVVKVTVFKKEFNHRFTFKTSGDLFDFSIA